MSGISGKFRSSGFTLIELMITIALIAIIAGFAIPQFGNMIERNRVVSTTNSVVGLLHFARSEAIRQNRRVAVQVEQNVAWAVRVDQADPTFDPDDANDIATKLIRRIESPSSGTTVAAPGGGNVDVEFRSSGMIDSANDLEIQICSGSVDGRLMVVTRGGRINTAVSTNCP